jgi:PIN domain nuclease of toxin-antitoxin system
VPDSIAKQNLLYSTLPDADIYFLECLPKPHRDPFDRLLVCHAIINGLTILSPATLIHQYLVNYVW